MFQRSFSVWCLVLVLGILGPSCTSRPPLRPAVEAHLAALTTRNMDALLPTLTSGTDLQMIGPDGTRLTTRQAYVDFHRQWFAANDNGKLSPEIIHLIDAAGLGHVLIRYRYSSTDPTGKPQESVSWLALTFALENGTWRLVFDQNTLIAPKPATP